MELQNGGRTKRKTVLHETDGRGGGGGGDSSCRVIWWFGQASIDSDMT